MRATEYTGPPRLIGAFLVSTLVEGKKAKLLQTLTKNADKHARALLCALEEGSR